MRSTLMMLMLMLLMTMMMMPARHIAWVRTCITCSTAMCFSCCAIIIVVAAAAATSVSAAVVAAADTVAYQHFSLCLQFIRGQVYVCVRVCMYACYKHPYGMGIPNVYEGAWKIASLTVKTSTFKTTFVTIAFHTDSIQMGLSKSESILYQSQHHRKVYYFWNSICKLIVLIVHLDFYDKIF